MAPELLLRAADQGETYLTWRWLDNPEVANYAVLDAAALTDVLDELASGLPHPLEGESADAAIRRALLDGCFADQQRELTLAIRMSGAVLPAELTHQLAAMTDLPQRLQLRIIPSPRLARIPWELLMLPDGHRLVEIADISHDAPASLHANRDRLPTPWATIATHPVLYLLDPHTDHRSRGGTDGLRLGTVIEEGTYVQLTSWVDQQGESGRILSIDRDHVLRGGVGRRWLGERLRGQTYARMLYYGHASAGDDEPGSAAIHLADGNSVYGLASAIGGHRPFTALDVLLGTVTAEPNQANADWPIAGHAHGHQIWPMPSRVAIIACDSGADYRHVEPFGLIMAYLNAGAELLTATRWTLPTDYAFHAVHSSTVKPTSRPTTELMLQVDRCHDRDHPVNYLAEWQRTKLADWISQGEICDTPLIWAALATHLAPGRSAAS